MHVCIHKYNLLSSVLLVVSWWTFVVEIICPIIECMGFQDNPSPFFSQVVQVGLTYTIDGIIKIAPRNNI